jgi:hypothetical protein
MTSEQRAAIDPSSREYYNRVWGSKIQVAGWSLYAMVLWLVKFSLAVFYSRLTCVPRPFSSFTYLRLECST